MQDSTQNEFLQDKTTIFMACDGALDFALANMIIGLKRYNEDLIDKIYVFYDTFDDETLSKISSIWSDKIIWKQYSLEDFHRDIKDNDFLKNHPDIKRYTHFNYSKFYIFDILEKANTQSVLFLDVDMLCTGSLKELIEQKVDILGSYIGYKGKPRFGYYKRNNKQELEDKHITWNGGLTMVFKSIFKKAPKNYLTKKCFEIFVDFANHREFHSEETTFGVVATLYNFSFADSVQLGYNCVFSYIVPHENKAKLFHALGYTKFWSYSPSFISFEEWFVNYKIWVLKYGGVDKIKPPKFPLNLQSRIQFFYFIDNYEFIQNHLYELCSFLKQLEIFYSFLRSHLSFTIVLDGIIIYFELNPWDHWGTQYIHIELKFQDSILAFVANESLRGCGFSLNDQKVIKNYKPSDKHLVLTEIKEFLRILKKNKFIKTEIKDMKFIDKEYSAVTRVRNHLAYRLGTAIIVCNKSLWGLVSLPFVLSFIKAQYKKEQAAYQSLIKQKPEFKLPKIENYPDYKAALKEKECLTYKLGEAMIRAGKAWYKGGLMKFYFEAKRLEKEFKNK